MSMLTCLRNWWGWVVVSLASMQWALSIGPTFNYSIFLLRFQEEFHTSTAITGWVGSITHSLMSLGALPALILLRKVSPRALALAGVFLQCGGFFATAFVPSLWYAFLTYGLLVGLGTGFIVQAGVTLALSWFPSKYCARATTLLTLGTPCGTFISAPILNALISAHGWRHAFMMFSAGIFVISAPAALFLTTPVPEPELQEQEEQDENDTAETIDKLTEVQPLDGKGCMDDRSPEVPGPFYRRCDPWLWCVGVCAGSLSSTFLAINLASFMDNIGLTGDNISQAIVILALGEIVAKIFISVFGDALPFLKMYVIAGSFVGGGVMSGFLTLMSTFTPVLALSFLFGMARACFYALAVPSSMEIFQKYGVGVVSMLVMLPFGIGTLMSAPVSGGLYDLTGDYTLSLLVLTALLALSTGCMLLIPIKRKIRSWRMRRSETSAEICTTQKYSPTETSEKITEV